MAESGLDCSGWLLAGGEGRRVGGRDKGLIVWQGRAMADRILASMAGQVHALGVIANRHPDQYATLLSHHTDTRSPGQGASVCRSMGVHPDAPTLPRFSGPLGGMLTAMQKTTSAWVWFLPCDMPMLPHDMLATLWQAAHQKGADIAVPSTRDEAGELRHHWVCALMHQRVMTTMWKAFDLGERKVGHLIARCNWTSVSFDDVAGFVNLNTLETKHGGD